jgi:DNA transformation protein
VGLDPAYNALITELLAEFGPVRISRMFGGAGVFADEFMIGLIDGGALYLRADDQIVAQFEAGGSRRFTYPSKVGDKSLNYWSLPDEAADDPEVAAQWARLSLEAARRKAAGNRPKAAKAQLRKR